MPTLKRSNKIRKLVTFMLCSLLLTSCVMDKRPVFFKAEIEIDAQGELIISKLTELENNKYFKGKEYRLTSIVLYEYVDIDKSRSEDAKEILWKLRYKSWDQLPRLPESISYGEKIPGMTEVIKAKPLESNKKYKIDVDIDRNDILGIWSYFQLIVDSNGKIISISREP